MFKKLAIDTISGPPMFDPPAQAPEVQQPAARPSPPPADPSAPPVQPSAVLPAVSDLNPQATIAYKKLSIRR